MKFIYQVIRSKVTFFKRKMMYDMILSDLTKKLIFRDRSFFRDREILFIPDIRSEIVRKNFSYSIKSYNLPINLFKEFLFNNLEIIFYTF